MTVRQRVQLLICVFTAMCAVGDVPLLGQGRVDKFRVGSRVEVRDGDVWVPGTVVEGPGFGNRIEVRLDDDPDGMIHDEMPAQARGHFLTRSYAPDEVRPVRSRDRRAGAGSAGKSSVRTWTDRTGKFKIEARFERVNGDKVVLRKRDGKQVEVPLDRLSEGDAAIVNNLQNEEASPFQEVEGDADADVDAEPDASTPSATTAKANWKTAKTIRPQSFAKWTFVPSARETRPAGGNSTDDISIVLEDVPDSQKFFEGVVGVYVSSDDKRALIGREQGVVATAKRHYVENLDLESVQSRGLIALPPATKLLDAFADEGLIAYRPEIFGSGSNTVLTIARVGEDGRLSTVASFEPYGHEDWPPRRDVATARFLGAGRLLTSNDHGEALTIWDLEGARALANIPVGHANEDRIALSPDRRLLAVIMESGIAIIELANVRHVATLPIDDTRFHRVCFSDDNRRLAAVSDDGLAVWDLSTGEQTANFYHPRLSAWHDLAWAGDYLLVGNRYLFDADRRILLWEYQSTPTGDVTSSSRGGRHRAVSRSDRNGPSTFVSTALPHAAALELAAGLPTAEQLLVVRPGDKVALEIDIDPAIASPDTIRESLTKALEAAQLEVVDKSKLVLKAICKQQPTQTIKINIDNRWPRRESDIVERTITPHASYLELSLDGEPLWKQGFVATAAHIIPIEEGETLDQALARLTKPNLAVFEHAKFSPYVARPGKATADGAYGVSHLTPQGVVDSGAAGDGGAFR